MYNMFLSLKKIFFQKMDKYTNFKANNQEMLTQNIKGDQKKKQVPTKSDNI